MRLRLLKKETVIKMRFSLKDFGHASEGLDVLRKRYPNYRLRSSGPKVTKFPKADLDTCIINIEVPVE